MNDTKNAGRSEPVIGIPRRTGIGLIAPRVNINGTSKRELMEQYSSAIIAIHTAVSAVRQAWPHGRDYQTLKDGVHPIAQSQHQSRIERLTAVHDELAEILERIDKQ